MNRKYKDELIQTLLAIADKKEMIAFLQSIHTPQELEELPKRLAIFKLLNDGVSQHEIAHKMGVGVATVTRGSLELKRGQIQKTSWWQNLSSHIGG